MNSFRLSSKNPDMKLDTILSSTYRRIVNRNNVGIKEDMISNHKRSVLYLNRKVQKKWKLNLGDQYEKAIKQKTFKKQRTKELKDYMRERKRSIDILDINGMNKINKLIYDKKNKFKFMNTKMTRSIEDSIKRHKDNVQNLLIPRNLSSRKGLFNYLKRNKTERMFNISSKYLVDQHEIDRIIVFLKQFLSSNLYTSVYLKDFIKLYQKFVNNRLVNINYRSKSQHILKPLLSQKKHKFNRIHDFHGFLINLYKHYFISNNPAKRFTFGHILSENIKDVQAQRTSKKLKKIETSLVLKKYDFKFLKFNKDAKRFCLFIKEFNKNGYIKGKDKPNYYTRRIRNKKDVIVPKINSANIVDKENNDNNRKLSTIQPVANKGSAFLFQKMVNIGLSKNNIAEKKERKQRFMRSVKRALIVVNIRKNEKKKKPLIKPIKRERKLRYSFSKTQKDILNMHSVYNMPNTIRRSRIMQSFDGNSIRNQKENVVSSSFLDSLIKRKLEYISLN